MEDRQSFGGISMALLGAGRQVNAQQLLQASEEYVALIGREEVRCE